MNFIKIIEQSTKKELEDHLLDTLWLLKSALREIDKDWHPILYKAINQKLEELSYGYWK